MSPARMCLTLGCLCRLRQPLKQKVTLIYGPWIYGRYISRHSVIAFLWPISRGDILESLGAGTAVGTLTSVTAVTPSPKQQRRDNPATTPECPKC